MSITLLVIFIMMLYIYTNAHLRDKIEDGIDAILEHEKGVNIVIRTIYLTGIVLILVFLGKYILPLITLFIIGRTIEKKGLKTATTDFVGTFPKSLMIFILGICLITLLAIIALLVIKYTKL